MRILYITIKKEKQEYKSLNKTMCTDRLYKFSYTNRYYNLNLYR